MSSPTAVMPVLRRLLAGHYRAAFLAALVALVASALTLVQPILAGRVVNAASQGSLTPIPTVALAGFFVLAISAEAVSTYLFSRLGENVVYSQRCRYAAHLIALPVPDLDHHRIGDLVTRGTAGTSELQEFPRLLSRIVIGAITLTAAIGLMIHTDPVLGLTIIAIVGGAFVGGSLLLARVQSAAAARQSAVGEYGARLERAVGAVRTVKMFGAQRQHSDYIDDAADAARKEGIRMGRLAMAATPIVRIAATGSLILVLVIGGGRVANGDLTIGGMVALLLFTLYSLGPLQDVYDGLTLIRRAVGANERIDEILLTPREANDPGVEAQTLAVAGPQRVGDSPTPVIAAQTVNFSYGNRPVLKDISFDLAPNQITALVGPSGSGKSTLLSLLCRFYEPTSGEFFIDGRPYSGNSLSAVRRHIALVEQDNPVFHGSLRDNLLMGNPVATDHELWHALEQVNLVDTIRALPDELASNALDRGRALSGGERQRLAIARALLSPAELILLDEPTAHLDRENERIVMSTLIAQRGERTLLIVAHRISTVEQADQILYIDRGELVARGTHQRLLEDSPAYRNLVHERVLGSDMVVGKGP